MTQTDFHHAKPVYEDLPGLVPRTSARRRSLRGPAEERAGLRQGARGDVRRADLGDRRRARPQRDDPGPLVPLAGAAARAASCRIWVARPSTVTVRAGRARFVSGGMTDSTLPAATADPTGGKAVAELDRAHVFHSWSAQEPDRPAAGRRRRRARDFWDYDGNRFLDFSSQLVNTNIGHQHPKVVAAIQEQAGEAVHHRPAVRQRRARRGRPADRRAGPGRPEQGLLHQRRRRGDRERGPDGPAAHRPPKILRAYRSYHGNTATAITMTGDPRRWANERPGTHGGVVHFFGPYLYRSALPRRPPRPRSASARWPHLEQTIHFEGPATIAAIMLETVLGTAGILVPPPGYLRRRPRAVRPVRHPLHRRRGHGRLRPHRRVVRGRPLGRHPRPDHLRQGRQLRLRPARRGDHLRRRSPTPSRDRAFPGGLTYSGHPLACASAVATINAMHEEGIVEHAALPRRGRPRPRRCASWPRGTRAVGEVRGLGAFWALDLVKDRETRELLVPYNAAGADAAPMNELSRRREDARRVAVHATSTGCTWSRRCTSPRRRRARGSRAGRGA